MVPAPVPPNHPWLHRLWPIGKYVQSKVHQHAVIRTQHLVKQPHCDGSGQICSHVLHGP